MADPVLHLLAGPNGAGKSTLYDLVIGPVAKLEFVNADLIAAHEWPGAVARYAYDASRIAAERRAHLLTMRTSFVTETVFSHKSKVGLVGEAAAAGYLVMLHVVLIPEDLAVARVANRVVSDGHDVPEDKIRSCYARLWPLVGEAIALADETTVYDNSSASQPFRVVASFERGLPAGKPNWPRWTPEELRATA